MKTKSNLKLAFLLTASALSLASGSSRQNSAETNAFGIVPRTWDDSEIVAVELPLAAPAATPKHITADYYYRIPVRPVYKSYPVYALGKEPEGYVEGLSLQEPQTVFETSQLRTAEDWLRAGEIMFDAPIFYNAVVRPSHVKDPKWYESTGVPVAKDGTLPYFRYVIREKGKIEMGTVACGMCHTRVMSDGTVVKGAQGNFPFDRAAIFNAVQSLPLERARLLQRSLFGAPWIQPNPQDGLDQTPVAEIARWHSAIPPGVMARQGSSVHYPPQIPDLIGVKERKYLDHSGLVRHRSIADMMRYSALNQGADDLASYAGFIPGAGDFRTLPEPSTRFRYSDEQLYALSLYLYSLKPPPNPNRFDDLAARGRRVFEKQKCGICHPAPLYTNNRLTPVEGFEVPAEHLERYDILPVLVGTDPNLSLKTRRGTGYYKVPSLKGLWYRGPFEHNGSVASLEDWFDPRRLNNDYVPTGFRGANRTTRAVNGHLFGMDLSPENRRALIAFLKTL